MDIALLPHVKSYVYKYCTKLFCKTTQFGPTWRLNLRDKEGKFLYALLERTPDRYEKFTTTGEQLYILVPSKIAYSKGAYLSQQSIDLFNEYIKQCIVDEILLFHTGIATRIGLKMIDRVTVNQYQADNKIRVMRVASSEAQKFFWQKSMISDILAKYDIVEEEISTDSIVKHLQRHTPAHYSAS